jgi:hypothetical protein
MNQERLIKAFNEYEKLSGKVNTETQDNFSGWIGRLDTINDKLSEEFHLKGKYFSYYGDIEPPIEERYFLEDKKVVILSVPYKGFHWHFSVVHPLYQNLELVKNKLYYCGNIINDKLLLDMNNQATAYWNNNYGVFENYADTNNFIYFLKSTV